jgi:hypothetical protein
MHHCGVTTILRSDHHFRFEVVGVLPSPLVPIRACVVPDLEGHTTIERRSYDGSLWLCFDLFVSASMLFLGVAFR